MIKLKKINIKQFGAIKNFKLDLGTHGATIIYGKNETGKTMILDAILDALFSANRLNEYFVGLNRYSTQSTSGKATSAGVLPAVSHKNIFEGEIELNIDNSVVKFPQNEPLDQIISIPPLFAQNMFVVRDGELKFNRNDEWWSLVKNKLLGFSGDYLKVIDKIRDFAGLEKSGDWMDSETRPIKSQHEKLNKKLEDLKIAKENVKELTKLSEQYKDINDKLQVCKTKLKDLQSAKKKHCYLKSKVLINKYRENSAKSVKYAEYNISNMKLLRNAEIEIQRAKQYITLSTKHRDSFLTNRVTNVKAVEVHQKEVENWENLEEEFINPLEVKLANYKQQKARLQRGSTSNTMMPIWIGLCAVSLIATIFISLKITPVFFTISGILFITLCFCIKLYFSSKGTLSQLESYERTIKESFKRIDTENRDVDYINNWVFENRNQHLNTKKRIRAVKESELPDSDIITKELTSSITALENKLQKLESYTKALTSNTDCLSWEDLQEKCKEKEALDLSLKMLPTQINQVLETKWEQEWEERLTELEDFKDVNINWDENFARQQEEQITSLTEQVKALSDKMVETKINAAQLGCRTLEEVWLKEDEVKKELDQLELDKEAALLATEVLEKVSYEQDNIVNNIITDGADSASDLFATMTANRYKKVFLDKDKIYITTTSGKTLNADHLSSGALAQLYFGLRINFAEKLLKNAPGFFLLDEAFLTCDSARKDEMIHLLKQLTDRGWQFIYFTNDENIVKSFNDCFENKLNIHILAKPVV